MSSTDIYSDYFLPNKYTKWYIALVKKAKNRHIPDCYTEKHHIIPRSFGGSNESDNLIVFTAREHYIAHLLLTKMCLMGKHKNKMIHALWCFYTMNEHRSNRNIHFNSHIYLKQRKEFIDMVKTEYKKKLWWNNGKEQVFSPVAPDNSFIRGRLPFNNIGAKQGAKINSLKIWITDGTNNKMIFKNNPIPNGWYKGRTIYIERKSPKNKIWWNNGIREIFIHGNPPTNFIKGRIKSRKTLI